MTVSRTMAKAPGRCGILGNPSDIYGGKVLSCSIPAYATCILAESASWVLPDDVRLWDAAQKRFPIPGPLSVTWLTDVPRSSGLSGSTALLAATIAASMAHLGHPPSLGSNDDRTGFAEMVRQIERYDADIMCGYQDAYMIVNGGIQFMDFAGKHPVEKGPPAHSTAIDAPLPFLLITTGVERLSGSVHGPLATRWLNGEQIVRDSIAEISELAEPAVEWLRQGDLRRFGQAMDRNHALVAQVGGSGDDVDRLVGRCKDSGALGAKLAGAGMGGTIIALTENADDLETKLRELGYNRFIRPEPVPGVSVSLEGNVI